MRLEERFAYQSFRPGQKEFAERVYEACINGETVIAEAMSGFGKTAAVIAGALSAAEETGCRVAYACRTKRQINRVVEEISRLQEKHHFTAASLLSKFDYCLLRHQRPIPRESFGWYCSFNVSNNLCSYFLNVTFATSDFEGLVVRSLSKTPAQHDLLREAEKAHLCPYEVARLAMVQAQMAVAPYQYFFDPRAAPILTDRSAMDKRKTILVVDEAHNMRDFLRGIHSATISIREVQGAVREAKAMLMDEAAESLAALGYTFENAIAERPGWLLDRSSILDRFRNLKGTVWLQNLAFELSACSDAAWGSVVYERRFPSLILRVGDFLAKLSSADGTVLVKWEDKLGIVDPNPARDFGGQLAEFRSSVLISATISPSSVFKRSLGLGSSAVSTYEAPMEPLVEVSTLVDKGTSTRYKLRNPEMFAKIADKVAAIVNASGEGVGVFAPSYSMLGAIFDLVSKRTPDKHLVAEAPGLSSQDASDLFDSFRSGRDSVLFAVQGGRFSEGEDFSGDSMGSVIVVGLSLPPPSPMMYAEYACLKRMGEQDSYLMLSRLPALRKAFQAAGRHIRSPGKRGLVFLLDERFDSAAVTELMPLWLRRNLVVGDFSPQALAAFTHGFWSPHG